MKPLDFSLEEMRDLIEVRDRLASPRLSPKTRSSLTERLAAYQALVEHKLTSFARACRERPGVRRPAPRRAALTPLTARTSTRHDPSAHDSASRTTAPAVTFSLRSRTRVPGQAHAATHPTPDSRRTPLPAAPPTPRTGPARNRPRSPTNATPPPSWPRCGPPRLRTEVLAGLVVALALIPEAISFSIIAGVDPRVGLFASFTMAVSIAFFGGRPAMISAATGAIALVIAPVMRHHGMDYLIATVILGGLIQVLLGVLGVAKLMRFIPRSVMVGFVNALAILIFLAQVPHLVGVPWAVYPLVAVGILVMVFLPKVTTGSPRRWSPSPG